MQSLRFVFNAVKLQPRLLKNTVVSVGVVKCMLLIWDLKKKIFFLVSQERLIQTILNKGKYMQHELLQFFLYLIGCIFFDTSALVVGSGIVTRRPLVLQLIHIPQSQEHFDGNYHIEAYYDTNLEGKDFIVQRDCQRFLH